MRYQKPIFLAKLVSQNLLFKSRLFICCVLVAVSMSAMANDWPTWRGPNQDGTSAETGLISSWSVEGENLLWEAEFIGRSTPIILTTESTSWDVSAKTSPNRSGLPASTLKPANASGIISLTSFIPRSPSTASGGQISLATPKQGISTHTVSKDFSSALTKMGTSSGRVRSQRSMDGYPVTADAYIHLLSQATLLLSVILTQDGAITPRRATAISL